MRFKYAVLSLILAIFPEAALAGPVDDILAKPIFADALDYQTIPDMSDCTRPYKGKEAYFYCKDSRLIYDKALANAKASGHPLMVIFGFNTCPSCVQMERAIFNPVRPLTNGDIMQFLSQEEIKDYVEAKKARTISVVRIHARSEHGLTLANHLGATKMANDRGWHRVWSPFILFVNPETGAYYSESYWEAKQVYCDWRAELATNIEGIGMAKKGRPFTARKRCDN